MLSLALLAGFWGESAWASITSFEDYALPVGANPQSFYASNCISSAGFDSNTATLYQNMGGGVVEHRGTFDTVSQPSGAACGDFTGDGVDDVAVASWADGTIRIYRSAAEGGFTAGALMPVGRKPQAVAAADLNLDGQLDLLVANAESSDLTLLFGDGNGQFPSVGTLRLPRTDGQANIPRAVQVADFDQNGFPDIAVASQGNPSFRLLLGDGLGFHFFDGPLPAPGKLRGVGAGDLNNDNIPDLALLSTDSVISLYTGTGTGTFVFLSRFPSRATLRGVALGDFSADGLTDLALLDADANAVQIVRAVAPGQFPTCGGEFASPFLCPRPSAANPLGNAAIRIRPDDTNAQEFVESPQLVFLDQLSRQLALLEPADTTFTTSTLAALPAEPETLLLVDLTNDTHLDAVITLKSGRRRTFQILLSNPAGEYAPLTGPSTCGNGILEGAELCDDGNQDIKDGCGLTCTPVVDSGVLSMGAADLDADGNQDLVVLDAAGNLRALLGNGLGQFRAIVTFSKARKKTWAAVADFNGDGSADIAFVPKDRRAGPISVLVNNGVGQFTTIALGGAIRPSGAILASDIDRNGFADLLVAQPKGLTVFYSDAVGPLRTTRLVTPALRGSQSLHLADFNEDGWPDILVGFKKQMPLLYSGKPNSTFSAGAPIASKGRPLQRLFVADVNGDVHQDVASCDPLAGPGCQILYGDGSAHFSTTPAPAPPSIGRDARGAAVADFDDDGALDLAGISRRDDRLVIHFDRTPSLPASSLVLETGASPSALGIADLNDDGRPDLVAANEGTQDLSVFTNVGGRRFNALARIKLPFAPSGHLGMTITDANGDGRPDIAVVQASDNRVTLFLNSVGAGFGVAASLATGPEPRGVGLGDLNGDALFDMVTANRGDNTISIFLSNPDGTYARRDIPSQGVRPWDAKLPDLDGDGLGDLVVLNELRAPGATEGSLLTFLNDGTGEFGSVVETVVRGREFSNTMCLGDFNGDSQQDVAVGSIFTGDIMVLQSAGDGTWTPDQRDYPAGDLLGGVTCYDANNDGRTDLAFARRRQGDVAAVITVP